MARAIVDANAYLTLATADDAGRPWVSPVWFAHDGYQEFLWASQPTRRHSQNVAQRPKVAMVIFDSTVPIGSALALYLEGEAHAVDDAMLERTVAIYSQRLQAQGQAPWSVGDVTGDRPLRLYCAHADAAYVLDDHDDRVPVRLGAAP